jgi:hypothetical protein
MPNACPNGPNLLPQKHGLRRSSGRRKRRLRRPLKAMTWVHSCRESSPEAVSPLNATDPLGRAQRGRGDPPRPAQAQAIARASARGTSPPDPSSRASPSTSVSHRSWRTGPARNSRPGHNLRARSCRTATVGRGRPPSPLAAGWITARVEAAHSLVVEGLLVGVVVAVKHPVRFGLASQPQL